MKYEPLLHVVLYEPEIAFNTGSVGRTCVAVGAKLWLVRPLGYQIEDRRLKRAGLDYWQHLEWEIADDWAALCRALPEAQMWLLSKSASRVLTAARFARGDVLVFGGESRGLPPALIGAHESRTLRIPIRPQVRSLNLSVAVAVAAYEAQRQIVGRGETP